jgi:hypothetical protein
MKFSYEVNETRVYWGYCRYLGDENAQVVQKSSLCVAERMGP